MLTILLAFLRWHKVLIRAFFTCHHICTRPQSTPPMNICLGAILGTWLMILLCDAFGYYVNSLYWDGAFTLWWGQHALGRSLSYLVIATALILWHINIRASLIRGFGFVAIRCMVWSAIYERHVSFASAKSVNENIMSCHVIHDGNSGGVTVRDSLRDLHVRYLVAGEGLLGLRRWDITHNKTLKRRYKYPVIQWHVIRVPS